MPSLDKIKERKLNKEKVADKIKKTAKTNSSVKVTNLAKQNQGLDYMSSEVGVHLDSFSATTPLTDVNNVPDAVTGEFKTVKSEDGQTKIIKQKRIINPLHNLATYNSIITFAVCDLVETNFPEVLQKRDPKFPIAQTAGKHRPANSDLFQNFGLDLEFLVNNLEVQTVAAPEPKRRLMQGTKISFEIQEPYSMGLLFSQMQLKANLANGDANKDVNYREQCYVIIVDFVGEPDSDIKELAKINQIKQDLRNSRIVIPIKVSRVEFNVRGGGTTYQFEAFCWNEHATVDENLKIKHDVTLRGKTVHEMLQTGESSLMAQLNGFTRDKKNKRGGSQRLKKASSKVKTYNEDTVIFFPDIKDSSEAQTPDESTLKSLFQDRQNASVVDTGDVLENRFDTRNEDEAVKTLLDTAGKGITVTNQFSDYSKEGLRVSQKVNNQWTGNDIGNAKMLIDEENAQALGNVFPDIKEAYNDSKRWFPQGGINIDFKTGHLQFEKGTLVSDIIETVIILSEYGKKLYDRTTQIKEKPEGEIPWFRIFPKSFQLKDYFYKSKVGKDPQVNVLNVYPYHVPEAIFTDPGENAPQLAELKAQIVKQYDYIYTGSNQDILDFEIVYRFAFYNETPKNSQDSSEGNTDGNSATKSKGKEVNWASVPFDDRTQSEGGAITQGGEIEIDRMQGTEYDSITTRIARMWNERIINSPGDLVQLNVRLVGDPYFLPNSGFGNFAEFGNKIANDPSSKDATKMTKNGRADFLNRMNLVEFNFRSPVDYDLKSEKDQNYFGDLRSVVLKDAELRKTQLGFFSGMYIVTKVTSVFRQGKFEQEVTLTRPPHFARDAKSGVPTDKKQTSFSTGFDDPNYA